MSRPIALVYATALVLSWSLPACTKSEPAAEKPPKQPEVTAPAADAPANDDRPAAGSSGRLSLVELKSFRPLSDDPGCGDCTPATAASFSEVTASSFRAPKERFGADRLVDQELNTAWCSAPGSAVGAWIEVTLRQPMPVDNMTIHPGDLSSREALFADARPAELRVTIDGRDRFRVVLPEYPDDYVGGTGYVYPTVELDGSPVRKVRLTVDKVHPGKAGDSVCVSGIRLEVLDEP